MEKHPPSHLSASRLTSYEWCPQQFYRRYILGQEDPQTWEQAFGIAVHSGLEAHYNQGDYELTFLREWRAAKQQHPAAPESLTARGLELIEMVRDLGLTGTPESYLNTLWPDIPVPFLGYADLWKEGHIYDFKTTGFMWKPGKAERQIFQPAIYSQAHADAFGSIPQFTFVVMPRNGGPVQLIDATRTGEQITQAFERAKEIYDLIEAKEFTCKCGKCVNGDFGAELERRGGKAA